MKSYSQLSQEEEAKIGQRWDKKVAKAQLRKAARSTSMQIANYLDEEALMEYLKKKLSALIWSRQNGPVGIGKQRIDLWGRSKINQYDVFIEVEKHRAYPIHNLVKAWQYVHNSKTPVLLIQILSPYHYEGNRNTRRKQIIFVGQQAEQTEKNFTYRPIGKEFWPHTAQEGPTKIGDEITSLVAEYEKSL